LIQHELELFSVTNGIVLTFSYHPIPLTDKTFRFQNKEGLMPFFIGIITIYCLNTCTSGYPINENKLINLFNNKSILKNMGGL